VNNYTPITINYAPNGNITQKSDVGAYVYDATKVNAVKEVNSNNLDVLAQQNITYSSFQSPTLIKEGDYQLELLYSHDRSRKKTTLKQNNQTKQTTYFSGGYEKQVDTQNNTTELHYLNNINTIVVKQNNQYKYYFTYKDHLGTIVAITDINGNVVEEFNYDAWGLKRNPNNWTYELDTTPSTLTWFKRGYTGHEHLDEFGLINMNSRLYDPQIGRMLSPDNYIQSAGYSQNYNRYSYVWNNPMKFTDPSGDFVITAMIIGAGIGMWQGGALANNGEINPIKWDYNSAKTWGYMAGGAIVGAASSYIGATIAASGMPMANTVGIAMSSYVNSVGTNIYTGGQ
jgi:RHS repeat-associated protein